MNWEVDKQKLKVRWKLERQTKRTHNKNVTINYILNQINHHWVVKIVQKTTIDMALASMIRKKNGVSNKH